MRVSILSTFLALFFVAFAGRPARGADVVLRAFDTPGKSTQLRVDGAKVIASPKWTPGDEEPPLSVGLAVAKALRAVSKEKKGEVSVEAVELRSVQSFDITESGPQPFVRWFYCVSLRKEGESVMVGVLLDGTVVNAYSVSK